MQISVFTLLVPVVAVVFYMWMHVAPKIDWEQAPVQTYPKCAKGKTQLLVFGGTSMLGKYIMESFRGDDNLCLINYGRSKCKLCDINVKGDLRDTRHVIRVLEAFDIETVLTSVKPPLLGIHYRVYVELNMLSMIELVKAAKSHGVKNFIYVSSIAASSHYLPHDMSTEDEVKPYLTDYEAPYDVSKRLAEDFLLDAHEPGVFNAISIRTSGIIGGDGDPYDLYRFPVILSFNCPQVIDTNFAGNIGDALYVVYKTYKSKPELGGQFYYLTGEHVEEKDLAAWTAEASGKPLLVLPYIILPTIVEWWSWFRFEHNIYSTLDLIRMALVPQTFDNSKFLKAFPDYKPKYTMKEAMFRLYDKKA
uniref:NAD-dependent epimerase/dehydratase domain-containing protein n=1 Tax=Mucochytrium quahogii TaxID=96639 RepID=A0A7S2W9C5_9STRA|mmetsp:Transcript_19063/g.31215  ORF Transcript_19063/g.31215 Transcript_19063/m.31215 type:complete len:362 (-) Transcript_19063:813-1898(-)